MKTMDLKKVVLSAALLVLMAGFAQVAAARCPGNGIHELAGGTLNAALTRIGTTPCTLLVSIPAVAKMNATVPNNVELLFTRGGSLVPKISIKIELKGPIRAPEDQTIFDVSRGGMFNVKWAGQIIANWWSGGNIAERWNNMRASINLQGKKPGPHSFKVVGEHVFSTPFNMTGFRSPGQYTIDFSDSYLIAAGIVGPALDMKNSRGFHIYNLSLAGDKTNVPEVGVLLATNSGINSGQHIFYGAQIIGWWKYATVYNVESEVNHFIGGNYQNDNPIGSYVMYFGRDNKDNIMSSYGGDVAEDSTATIQNLSNLRISGQVTEGGIYLRGFSNVHINEVFVKNGGAGAQITLDNSKVNMTGIEITRLQTEGKSGTAPTSALRITGGKTIGNLIYDHVSDGATDYAVNIESGKVLFSEFRVNSSNDFLCGRNTELEQVRIEMTARNQASGVGNPNQRLTLGKTFIGEIYMGNPETNLDPATDVMEARIHDFSVSTSGTTIRHSKLHFLESGAPTILLESTDTGGSGTQARLEFKNTVSNTPYDWQIYGKGQRNEGQLAIRDIMSNTDALTIKKIGYVGVGIDTPVYELEVAGSVRANDFLTPSDARLKKNITPIGNSLAKVLKLRGVTFEWKRDQFPGQRVSADRQIGFIAQETEEVLPEVVSQGNEDSEHAIDYGRIVPVLVEAVKELNAQVTELHARLEDRENFH